MKKTIAMLALILMGFGVSAPSFAQTKKDGSKDMRYKANKTVKKKDGTPDMRYKSNKKK